ncbi:MAG: hypothetical protein ACFE7E_00915 [Candidatus Hodarchaeota archaeon]
MSDDLLAKRVAEFTKIFNDMLLLVLTKFPDSLTRTASSDARLLATENLLNLFNLELDSIKKAMKAFQTWIRVREDAVNCTKSLLRKLHELTEKKTDLKARIKLFILPLLEDLMRVITRDKELDYYSEIGPVLLTISKSIDRSDSMLHGISTYLEFAGYNPKKLSLEAEEFFDAIANRRVDAADYLLENMKRRLEKAKRRILKSR